MNSIYKTQLGADFMPYAKGDFARGKLKVHLVKGNKTLCGKNTKLDLKYTLLPSEMTCKLCERKMRNS